MDNTFDWFVLIGAGISTISGVITLLSSTEAERRWSAYEELRDRLRARGEAEARRGQGAPQSELELEVPRGRGPSIAPMASGGPGSGVVGVTGTF